MSVDQYISMIDLGIIAEDDPVELLEGFIVEKMGKNPPHIMIVGVVEDELRALLPKGWFVNKEQPIKMSDSMPEPDCSIVRGNRRDYPDRYVTLQDVTLVIEVSDTTLRGDRSDKKRIYAHAHIPVYWIINLPQRQIEVYSHPAVENGRPVYQESITYHENEQIPVVIDGLVVGSLAVVSLLP